MLADVSKQTFKGRDDLILAVLLRETEPFLDHSGDRMAAAPDIETAIIDAGCIGAQQIRHNSRLAVLFAPEVVGIISVLAGRSEVIFERSVPTSATLLAAG